MDKTDTELNNVSMILIQTKTERKKERTEERNKDSNKERNKRKKDFCGPSLLD